MPARFTAVRAAFTPSTSNDNWIVAALGGTPSIIRRIGWGGRSQQSKAYRTRWYVPSAVSSNGASALTVQGTNPAVSNLNNCYSAWTVGVATPPADPQNLFAIDWNSQGSEGVLTIPGSGWFVWANNSNVPNSYVCCRNVQGTDANESEYWVTWEE